MADIISIEPLTAKSFAPFGDVIDANGDKPISINQGNCDRFHDLAALQFEGGYAGVSVFKAKLRALPYKLDLMERHPLGSQAFIPMCQNGFLVTVAPDDSGKPGKPRAFLTQVGQGINIHRNVWHGVLTPLVGTGLFAVVDRIGDGDNLQEYQFERGYLVKG